MHVSEKRPRMDMMIRLFKYRYQCNVKKNYIKKQSAYLRKVEPGCLSFVARLWRSVVVDTGDSDWALELLVLCRMLSLRGGDKLDVTESANFMA